MTENEILIENLKHAHAHSRAKLEQIAHEAATLIEQQKLLLSRKDYVRFFRIQGLLAPPVLILAWFGLYSFLMGF